MLRVGAPSVWAFATPLPPTPNAMNATTVASLPAVLLNMFDSPIVDRRRPLPADALESFVAASCS